MNSGFDLFTSRHLMKLPEDDSAARSGCHGQHRSLSQRRRRRLTGREMRLIGHASCATIARW